MSFTVEKLQELLPAVYRLRDLEQGEPLHDLLAVIAEQIAGLEENLDQLYDDQFIETAASWVVPYIGDLIGYRALHGVVPEVSFPRAEVANTIGYRRRKGTASMLEQLARDVTDWPARAVEFFELLATSQYMNHVRPHAGVTPDLRETEKLIWIDTAFDELAHAADVRRISTGAGRHNIPHVGIFLWRVRAFPLTRSPLVAADSSRRRFRLNPLGADSQLFADPETEDEITHLADPINVPLPLGRRWMNAHSGDYYGAGKSLLLERQSGGSTTAISSDDVRVADLHDVPGSGGSEWAHDSQLEPGKVMVDPVLGRVCFADAVASGETVLGSFHYGFTLPIGGGEYDRDATMEEIAPVGTVQGGSALQPELDAVSAGGTVNIIDSDRYVETPSVKTAAPADGSAGVRVVFSAADGAKPLLAAGGPIRLEMDGNTTVVIDGLTIVGGLISLDAASDCEPRDIILRHCTLVPGMSLTSKGLPEKRDQASLIILHPFAKVTIEQCILGSVVAVDGAKVEVRDSIIDATSASGVAYCGRPEASSATRLTVGSAASRQTGDGLTAGGELRIENSTVIGKVHTSQIEASNVLFVSELAATGETWKGPLWVERKQTGCVRFSYVPPKSLTPRRFQCQPESDSDVTTRPHFTSRRFGDPGYCQLRSVTPDSIRSGADDESEMGVMHELFQPQRETNLQLRLDEYLRFGLEAGFFYAT